MLNKSILLVDDETIILETLSRDLQQENFTVTTAASGEEAIGEIQKQPFGLVITDLVMSGLDGIQVLKEAKQKDPFTSVIILTGYGDLTSAIDALRLGADDYLLKPCDFEELLLRMAHCLAKQEAFKKVTVYEKMLPICCVCGKIRDDSSTSPGQGNWMKIDSYIVKKTDAKVSHSYCPDCYKKTMDEL